MNDKQFDRAMNAVVIAMFSMFILIAAVGIGGAIFIGLNEPTAPTYHCDGPGYPAPGTAEARACWIEESK